MRNAAVPHCPEVAGALIDARGRRANAHRLPIRRRPQGSSRPRMSKSDTKGFQCTGRMNENLGIMRLCSVRMSATQAFVSDLDIHGSFRAPALVPSGPRWGHHRQRGPGNSVSPPRRRVRPRSRANNGHAATTVDSSRVRAHPAWNCWPGGSCPVSPRSCQSSGSSWVTAARRARASSSQVWQRWARASPRSHSARESSKGTEPASRRCTTATSSSRARS